MTSLISNLSSFYKEYKTSKIIRQDWVIVNQNKYKKYKDSKITSGIISCNTLPVVGLDGEKVISKQYKVFLETKDDYRLVKYNGNFITASIAEREYDLNKEVEIWAVKRAKDIRGVKDALELNEEPPDLSHILNILNWKMSKKDYNNIDYLT